MYSTSLPVPSSDSRSMCTTRVIASSSRSRSWLTTSNAPRYDRRNLSSQVRASASRWLVGSSRRSSSLPPKRMRTSSARRRSPPESAPRCRSSRSARRPTPSASLRTSDSAAYPPAASNASCAALNRSMFSLEGFSSSAIRSFSVRARRSSRPRPESTWERTVVSSGTRVAPGVLRQVPGEVGPLDEARPRPVGAPEDPEQRGLAGAVAPDQAHLLARAHLERRAVDDPLPADLDHQATNGQHGKHDSRKLRAGSSIVARARAQIGALALIDGNAARGAPRTRSRAPEVRATEAQMAGADPPGGVPPLHPRRHHARAAQPGRVGARRRRGVRGVAGRPLRHQRDLPHRQLEAAREVAACGAWTTR